MQPEFEIAWHGSAWRDDRPAGEPVAAPILNPQSQRLPSDQPRANHGGRKPIIREEVERILRSSKVPLSAIEIHARLPNRDCTVAGVNSALFKFKCDRKIERARRRTEGVGKYRCTYRWIAPLRVMELEAVKMRVQRVEAGRLGGLKSGESRRRAAAS